MIEVPSEWHLYESDEMAVESQVFTADIDGLPIEYSIAFDGAEPGPRERQHPVPHRRFPRRGLDHPPGGRGVRDAISRRLLSQVAVPYEGLQITPELQEPFEFAEGFDGVRQLAVYTDPASGNEAAVYLISVTDDEDARIYSVAVGCSVECFMEHQEKISEVVDSWLVNVRA